MSTPRYNSAETAELNKSMLNDLFSGDIGVQKRASGRFETWVRTYQRDNGVARRITPPETVTDSDFDRALDTNVPFIIREKLPRSSGAISTGFDTGTFTDYMDAERYAIYLHRVWTPNYKIDKVYLTSFRGNLVDVFRDLMMQDMLQQEDIEMIALWKTLLGTKGVVNPATGIKQLIDMGPSITTTSVADAISGMNYGSNGLSASQAVVHRSFWWRLVSTFRADAQGRNMTEQVLLGKTNVIEDSLWGVSWKSVLDAKLVPPTRMYIMASPEYTGDFVTYGEAEVYTKVTSGVWLEMHAHEMYGYCVPDRAAILAVDFEGTQDDWYDTSNPPWDASSAVTTTTTTE